MANLKPSTENLIRQRTTWQHLPTKSIRVPLYLSAQLMDIARLLDASGQDCSIEELRQLQAKLEQGLNQKE